MKPLGLALLLLVIAEPPKVTTVRLPVHPKDLRICADYISMGAPRDVQSACKDASEIREWILRDGRPGDECAE